MIRNIFIFLAALVGGAVATLVIRAATFNPYKGHEGHPPPNEYSQMVTNTLSPTKTSQPDSAVPRSEAGATSADPHSAHNAVAKSDPHAGHGSATDAKLDGAPQATVNSICAICGMAVDPKLPTAQYQGKTIGFGCRMCPPKFKADPDRYGPYYLRNETINR